LNLALLLVLYPVVSLLGMTEDPAAMLQNLTQPLLVLMLITTMIFQWVIFLANFAGVHQEKTGLRGLGLKRIRLIDFAWAVAFLLAANLILAGLAWSLARIGLPMPGELALLVPESPAGRLIWVAVSLTAGFCEEIAFRGYLMTRLRILGRFKSWVIPTIVSALAFGICHAYQGIPGLIVISVYGLLFSLLYLRTGSLWPCIIAHFLQDFGYLFIPG
jgi:hypothetical protein